MFKDSSDIESDGRMIRSDEDPPGQKCVFINPGKLKTLGKTLQKLLFI